MELGETGFAVIQSIWRHWSTKEHPLAVPCRSLHLAVRSPDSTPLFCLSGGRRLALCMGCLREPQAVMNHGGTHGYQRGQSQCNSKILNHFWCPPLEATCDQTSAVTIALSLRLENRIALNVYPVI